MNHQSDGGKGPLASRGAVGGAAAEAGGEFRAGLAAYIAVHALSGRPLKQFRDLPVPTTLLLEADYSVDDIVVCTQSGRRVFIQAKSSCSVKVFADVVLDQFLPAIVSGEVADGDYLYVCSETCEPGVLDLAAALDRYVQDVGTSLPNLGQRDVVQKLFRRVSEKDPSAPVERALGITGFRKMEAADTDGVLMREAALILELSVLAPGASGAIALDVVRSEIRQRAARRYGISVRDLVARISGEGLELRREGGPAGREAKLLHAREKYLAQLIGRLDYLRFSIVGHELPPLRVTNLLARYGVSLPDSPDRAFRARPLDTTLRRWRRACLLGLPGSGKSTALEQLAAAWADDDLAPVPCLIPLRRVADRCRRSDRALELNEVMREAAESASSEDVDVVAGWLTEQTSRGCTAILLDGFDECGVMTGLVAETIDAVLKNAGSDCLVLVSARESVARKLKRFGLPELYLAEPEGLTSILSNIVDHAAALFAEPHVKNEWSRTRKNWIREQQSLDRDIWKVPLLSSLMTLLVCKSRSLDDLPATRAELLNSVVDASIEDWESQRKKHDERYRHTRDLDPDVLLEAFAALGHLIEEGVTNGQELERALQTELSRYAPIVSARAGRRLAAEVIDYWDEAVGVFVRDGVDGALRARSRLFAEIADARWASSQTLATKQAWHGVRVREPNKQESIALAGSVDREVRDLQFGELATAPTNAVVLETCIKIVEQCLETSEEHRWTLAQKLLEAARTGLGGGPRNTKIRVVDEDSWWWWRSLALIPLVGSHRVARNNWFADLSGDKRIIADALSCSDRTSSNLSVDSESEAKLRLVFGLPKPSRPDTRAVDEVDHRGRVRTVHHFGGEPSLAGTSEAVRIAVFSLKELSAEEVSKAEELSTDCRDRDRTAIARELNRRGFPGALDAWRRATKINFGGFLTQVQSLKEDRQEEHEYISENVGVEAPEGDRCDTSRVWSLKDYADVRFLLGIDEMPGNVVFESELSLEEHARFVDVVTRSADIDVSLVRQQARFVVQNGGGEPDAFWDNLGAKPSPSDTPQLERGRLTLEDEEFLVAMVLGDDDLGSRIARRLLAGAGTEIAQEALNSKIEESRGRSRYNCALALLEITGSETIWSNWLYGPDLLLRRAAARYLANCATEDQRVRNRYTNIVLSHPDDALRADFEESFGARVGTGPFPAAEFWDCTACGHRNYLGSYLCAKCGRNI